MNLLSYKSIGAACGVGFLAYCAYFDHQRRNAPDYRDRVRARRERKLKAQEEDDVELPPDQNDKEAIERFFINEIEKGEECMQAGCYDKAVKHFSYAVVFCPQPKNLLKYMHDALPPSAYTKLVESLAVVNKRVADTYRRIVIDEDVE